MNTAEICDKNYQTMERAIVTEKPTAILVMKTY